MTVQIVRKWGNSPAVRLPVAVMREAQIELDQPVEIHVENGRVILDPTHTGETLDELLSGIHPDNLHDEVDFGFPQGKERL